MLKPYLLRMNLQTFAAPDGGGEFGGYDPSTIYDGIGQGEPQVQPEGQGEPFQQPEPQVNEPQVLDFGGRKLQANEDLMGLHKDYTEQQRYITALTDQVNAYKQLAQQVPTQQPPVQEQAPQVSSNVAEWDEQTWQEFYDKPQDIIGQIVQQSLQQFASEKLDPIIQEREWSNEIQRMYDSFPDFDQYVGDIQQLVDQYPQYAGESGLENAYYRAKAMKGSMNPAQLAQDPQFLNQYVMNNPNVQNQMLNQYFTNKQQTNAQIPNAMGRGAGGFTPQSPESAPQTLREASRLFMKNLGIR